MYICQYKKQIMNEQQQYIMKWRAEIEVVRLLDNKTAKEGIKHIFEEMDKHSQEFNYPPADVGYLSLIKILKDIIMTKSIQFTSEEVSDSVIKKLVETI